MKRPVGLAIAVCALAAASVSLAASIPVTTCGGTIPAGQVGVLQNDVSCAFRCRQDPSVPCEYLDEAGTCDGLGGCVPDVFVLENGSRLRLNGHTIFMAYQADGVRCSGSPARGGRCTVSGPGTFAGAKGDAITSTDADLIVENVTIDRCDGAVYSSGRLTARGLVTLPGRENTVRALRGVRLRDSRIGGDYGVVTDGDVYVKDVELAAPGGIVAGGRVRGADILLSRSADVRGRDVSLRRATVAADPPTIVPVIAAERGLRLADSSVVDIESGRKPRLLRTSCETSTVSGTSSSWGVCAGD